jgi:hypothetical protein
MKVYVPLIFNPGLWMVSNDTDSMQFCAQVTTKKIYIHLRAIENKSSQKSTLFFVGILF